MTRRDKAVFFRTSGQGTTPAVTTKLPPFFPSSSAVCPCLAAPLLSVDFLVFRSRLSPSRRRLATMMPASFALKPDSSTPSGLEGLCRNITPNGSTPPSPAAGSSLGRASVLAQGMGEGLSSKFAGQARGKWDVFLSRLLTFANARGLRFFWGGATATERPGVLGGNDQKIERGIDRE